MESARYIAVDSW